MIYLDNSATTKPCSEAVEAVTKALTENWGNPSALYGFGIDTARQLRTARHQVAASMGAEPDRVFFTSGGTEADNWAIFSTVRRFGKKNKHIITTAIEHHAILHCMKELEAQGYEVTYLQPDSEGRITLDSLKAALRRDTVLVSIMMVNNEVGSVMPIAQMAKLTHKLCPDAIFHTDAVQGFLKIPFAAKNLGADLISVSSHKVHGPKGVGALYISPRLKSFPALLLGGGQESNLRSGTEGTPAIFGFAAACAAGMATFKEDIQREKELLAAVIDTFATLDGLVINGSHEAPHILSLSIPGVPTQNTINILQDHGICVSAGSACAKGHRSHVLEAMKLSPEVMDGSFRISLCRDTTREELDTLAEVIREKILEKYCR
ncbi:MAG: cysteine desulfurase family protein [Oscillospiraceae bacterium]|nr:cysteine desulfurase family protein [Oscillospiraceae bacterium]